MFKVTADVVLSDGSVTKGREYSARGVYDDGISMVTLELEHGRRFYLNSEEIVSIEFVPGDI